MKRHLNESTEERIAVVGLGYVGLPIALAFARKFQRTIGFDVSASRVASLRDGKDATCEVDRSELSGTNLEITTDPETLADANFFQLSRLLVSERSVNP